MRIIVIEKCEKRPPVFRLLSQPPQERIVDRIRVPQVLFRVRDQVVPTPGLSLHPRVNRRRPRRGFDPPPERDVASEDIQDAICKILVMGKTTSEAGFTAA